MSKANVQTWEFHALDTLFFKESRPMESVGNAELNSLFPPSTRTMIGAIKGVLGEVNGIDWSAYRKDPAKHELAHLIGYGDNLGSLSFEGVWIQKNGERLYPAPLNIMKQKVARGNDQVEQSFFMTIGDDFVQTDLGNIRLPKFEEGQAGRKVLENIWLTSHEFSGILSGKPPDPEKWFRLKPNSTSRVDTNYLLVEESRVGIARNNVRRNVEKGLLYQTKHVRLADDVSLSMDVSGLDHTDTSIKNHLIRLGGEGRMASINIDKVPEFITAPTITDDAKGIVLYLLTPMFIEQDKEARQPLPGFGEGEINSKTVWEGEINGITLTLHTAITGKAHREGGWDMQNHKPRSVRSYVPAGSVFYCTSDVKPQVIVETLHGIQIGGEQELGRGKIAVGLWK